MLPRQASHSSQLSFAARLKSVMHASHTYLHACNASRRDSVLQVFDAKDWDTLVMRSIVPKLAWALQDVLVINPLQQDLAPFHWLTAWHPVLPQHHMVNLLEFRFFPAWHRVLQHWLSSQPDFDEVTRWYLGWKVSGLGMC